MDLNLIFIYKVIEIVHDKINNNLVTRIEARNKWYHIQFWSLPELEFEYEVFANITMTSYARLVIIKSFILIQKNTVDLSFYVRYRDRF